MFCRIIIENVLGQNYLGTESKNCRMSCWEIVESSKYKNKKVWWQ